MKDSGSGWDLGPDLDHFSGRTRHALQYMNPNKINMDLVLDLLEYLGNTYLSLCRCYSNTLMAWSGGRRPGQL